MLAVSPQAVSRTASRVALTEDPFLIHSPINLTSSAYADGGSVGYVAACPPVQ